MRRCAVSSQHLILCESKRYWRQAPERMILAASEGGLDAIIKSAVGFVTADWDESRQADREEADSVPKLWDSLSVHDAIQQGGLLHLSI